MSDRLLVLDAGAVLSPFERFSPGRILIRGNRIESAGLDTDIRMPAEATRVTRPDLTLVPGFVEPHIHGCCGHDVMEGTHDALNSISKGLVRHGTTSFLPTTVSASIAALGTAIERLGALIGREVGGAQPLGIHLEGPFINPQKRGTHQPENVHKPDATLLSDWILQSNGTVKLVTLAPELEGSAAVTALAHKSGVSVGMGHSDASFSEAIEAANNGVAYAVHTFNAMRQFSHRDSGIVGAVLSDDRVFAEIIADGVHVAPEVVRIFARAKGPARILLATDAISATDMPDGDYALGGYPVKVVHGICRDAEGRLAGSTLTQDRALKNLIQWSGFRLDDALLSLTANPAAVLSLEGRGRIEAGAFADITALNNDLQVCQTYVNGRLVFER